MVAPLRATAAVDDPDDDPVLFFEDAVKLTRIPTGTLRRLRVSGDGPPWVKRGKRLRIRRSALMQWLAEYDGLDH